MRLQGPFFVFLTADVFVTLLNSVKLGQTVLF